jgi:hypothetical protein
MPKKKVYRQEDLNEAVEKYLEGMKLRNVCTALPNVPKRTITCLAKKKRDGIEAKRPGPPLILSVEIEDDSKISFGSNLSIVLSARSQATEYSTWTKLDVVKTVRQKKLWLCMIPRMFGASRQIPHSI